MTIRRNAVRTLVMIPAFAGLLAGVAAPLSAGPKAPEQAADSAKNHDKQALKVLDKFIIAIGGHEAVSRIKSMSQKGAFKMPAAGLVGTIETHSMLPSKFVVKMEMAGMQTIAGFDGDVAYSLDAVTGPRILEGMERAQLLEQADPHGPLHYRETYPTIEYVGAVEFGGQPAEKLRLVSKHGNEVFQIFSKDSGLLIGVEGTQASPMGEVKTVTTIKSYEEFGGLRVATVTETNMMGTALVSEIESVTLNDVDPAVFDLPDAIKTLVEDAEPESGG